MDYDFPFSWECHHPSFFRGVEINHQPDEPFGRENGVYPPVLAIFNGGTRFFGPPNFQTSRDTVHGEKS